jgi:peroxiredoxin
MAIQVGDKIPSVTLKRIGKDGMESITTDDFFKGRKVVVFSVPGAFTPACHNEHLPGYVAKADEIRSKGVDEIACLAVNDPFVMKAWSEQQDPEGKVSMLPDGNAELTKAMGLEMDASGGGLGTRGKRFMMVVDDGVVKQLEVEPGKDVSVSSAESCLTKVA